MFPHPKAKQLVRPTLARFVEDRLDILNMSYDELVDKMGVTATLLTQRIKNPGRFTPRESRTFIDTLEIKDFWLDLVVPFGFGLDAFSGRQLQIAVQEQGYDLGRINVAA